MTTTFLKIKNALRMINLKTKEIFMYWISGDQRRFNYRLQTSTQFRICHYEDENTGN